MRLDPHLDRLLDVIVEVVVDRVLAVDDAQMKTPAKAANLAGVNLDRKEQTHEAYTPTATPAT